MKFRSMSLGEPLTSVGVTGGGLSRDRMRERSLRERARRHWGGAVRMGREEPQAQRQQYSQPRGPRREDQEPSLQVGWDREANLGPSLPPLCLVLLVCRAHAEKKKDRRRNEGRMGRKERREEGKVVKIISDRGFPGGPAVKTPH